MQRPSERKHVGGRAVRKVGGREDNGQKFVARDKMTTSCRSVPIEVSAGVGGG